MSINYCSAALFLGDPYNIMHLKASVILSYQSAQKKRRNVDLFRSSAGEINQEINRELRISDNIRAQS